VAEKFPLLQGDRDVTVSPNEIVEGAGTEFLALLQTCFGEKFHDLQFAHLISDCLARTRGKRNCLLTRRVCVHWDLLLQIFRSLVEAEFAEREFYVYFHP